MSFPTDTQLRAICMAAKAMQVAAYPVNLIAGAWKSSEDTGVSGKALLDTEYAAVISNERKRAHPVRSPPRMQFKRVSIA